MGTQPLFKRPVVASFAWLLLGLVNVVPAEDVPLEDQCTSLAIYGCYVLYDQVLWNRELRPDHDGHLNNSAFHTVCSKMNEKSSCHKIISNCPQKAAMDLTRQEKGYELMRDFVCDIELFKDFQRALSCEDYEKMGKCAPPPPQEPEQPPFDPNGHRCRSTISGWVCREEALHPECSISLNRAKTSYSKAREAVALLMGCDYKSSGAPSVVAHEFFLCLIIVSLLRWTCAS